MEQNQKRTEGRPGVPSGTSTVMVRRLAFVVLVAVVATGGFVGGIQYQKKDSVAGSSALTASTSSGGFGGSTGGPGGMRNGGVGAVTAISSTSITIESQMTSGSKTYSITSSTKITKDDTTVSYNAIAVGTMVFVRTASTASTVATQITVSPTMGGSGTSSQSTSGGGSATGI